MWGRVSRPFPQYTKEEVEQGPNRPDDAMEWLEGQDSEFAKKISIYISILEKKRRK